MTDEAFPALTTAEQVTKSLAWDLGVNAMLTALGLNVPVIRNIIVFFTDRLWIQMRLGIDLAAISFVNAEHEKAFNGAYAALYVIAKNYGIQSPQFIEARKNAQKSLSAFSKYGAS